MAKSKTSLIILFVIALIILFVVGVKFIYPSLYRFSETIFYWLELFLLVYLAKKFRLDSGQLLYLALALTVLGAILNIFRISFSEQFLRISFVFWLLGTVLLLKELKKNLAWVHNVFGEKRRKGLAKTECLVCGYRLDVGEPPTLKAGSGYYYQACPNCSAGTLIPKPKRDEVEKIYKTRKYYQRLSAPVQNAFMQWIITRRLHVTSSEWINRNFKKGKILDVGCGNGEFLEELLKFGWGDVWGSDVSKVAAKNTAEKIGKERVKVGDFLAQKYKDRFDMVSFWHVLEHVEDPLAYLVKANKLLKKDGMVVGEVPNFDSVWIKVFKSNYAWIMVPEHILYFSRQSLEKALKEVGFKKIQIHSPPRALLNLALSLKKALHRQKIPLIFRWPIIIVASPFSILLTTCFALFRKGEVLRFAAQKKRESR